MPSMTWMMSTILRELPLMASMVCTTSLTTAPPRLAVDEASTARPLAECARSAFWRTVAVSCSMLAAVWASAETWASVRRDRSELPASISPADRPMESVDCLMRPTSSVSVSSMVPSAPSRRPKSPCSSVENSWLKSPAATVSAIRMAWPSGCTIPRRRLNQATRASTQTAAPSPSTHQRVCTSACSATVVAPPAASVCSACPSENTVTAIIVKTSRLIPPNAITSRQPIGSLPKPSTPTCHLLYIWPEGLGEKPVEGTISSLFHFATQNGALPICGKPPYPRGQSAAHGLWRLPAARVASV